MQNATDPVEEQLVLQFQSDNTSSILTVQNPHMVGLDHPFPTEEANALASRESFNKHLFRPNTYLHKWWARRSGTIFRYVLKQLCDDPVKRDYYSIGGLEGKIILDPMMGGGTIVHEAIRLGACAVGYDIDPIPVLQARATLTHIPLKEKTTVFEAFFQKLAKRLNPFFATVCPECGTECESQFVLYALRKQCLCGEALFVDSLRLREEPNGAVIELCPFSGVPFIGKRPATSATTQRWIYEKTTRKCQRCHVFFQELRDTSFTQRYVPIIIVGFCKTHGQFFKRVEDLDLRQIEDAKQFVNTDIQLPSANMEVPGGPKSNDLLNRGVMSFADLFTHRQIIYIGTCKDLLDSVDEHHRLWLVMLLSTSLEFNSILCGFKGGDKRRPGAIRHVFSHHAYSFPYTALENNPVFSGNTSGTLGLLFRDRIQAASLWAERPVERKPNGGSWKKVQLFGETDWGTPAQSFPELLTERKAFLVGQQDSSTLPLPSDSIDHIVTDPPYFDNVQYSDLAHFFRVWLRWMLPHMANWDYIAADSAVAETAQNGLKYQRVLSSIWNECHRVLKKPTGQLIFTFHHWRAEAWAHLTLSLKDAGFRLIASYTVQSENPISVHIRQLRALKHDSILVLKPRESAYCQKMYPPLKHIETANSYSFCSDCAQVLGFCLEADIGENEIFHLWHKALGAS